MFCVFYYFTFFILCILIHTQKVSSSQTTPMLNHQLWQSLGLVLKVISVWPPAPLNFAFLFSPPWPLGSGLCHLRHNEWDSESVYRSKEFVCSHTPDRCPALKPVATLRPFSCFVSISSSSACYMVHPTIGESGSKRF